jgi:G3E family GTPase|tara:strand:- start:1472 stop:2089 length:618 start_codon:yes stop_codon:yes gene_type:complete
MKIFQIAGFLGSGKTTALIKIAKELTNRGERIAIIVNDIGEVAVDGKIIEDYGLDAKEIASGCICCQVSGSFIETLSILHDSFNPDIVIVEPTGVAAPNIVKDVADSIKSIKSGALIKVQHAPILTIVDSSRIELLLKAVKRLVEKQIKEADIIGINKIDISNEDLITSTEKFVKNLNPQSRIIRISAKTGDGLSEIIEEILNGH